MIREELLALADELEAFKGDTCEECIAYEQPECKVYLLPCTEIVAKYCARKMRGAVERDGESATTVSAYDLLSDEDREAIAWVREHGGLDAVEKLMLEAELRREPDTWERLEADAEGGAKDYCAERGLAVDGCAYGQAKAADLVRRARALAEGERVMCEYCEGDVVTPVYERKKNGEYCSVDIEHDSNGFYLSCHHESNGWDAVTMDIYPRINYCPMCGRKLGGDERWSTSSKR